MYQAVNYSERNCITDVSFQISVFYISIHKKILVIVDRVFTVLNWCIFGTVQIKTPLFRLHS